jgi:hypothetical protein
VDEDVAMQGDVPLKEDMPLEVNVLIKDVTVEEDVADEELLSEDGMRNKKKLNLVLEEPIKTVPTLMVRSSAEYLILVAYLCFEIKNCIVSTIGVLLLS